MQDQKVAKLDRVVGRLEVKRGDTLHVGKDQWVQIETIYHGEDRSLVWLRNFYYTISLERGALCSVVSQDD